MLVLICVALFYTEMLWMVNSSLCLWEQAVASLGRMMWQFCFAASPTGTNNPVKLHLFFPDLNLFAVYLMISGDLSFRLNAYFWPEV